MTPVETEINLDELVSCIMVSRETFAAAYNTFANEQPGQINRFETIAARRQQRDPIAGVQDRAAADFAEALRQAKERNFLHQLYNRAGDSLFKAALPNGTLLAGYFAPDAGFDSGFAITHQAITGNEPLRIPEQVNAGLMTAQRRTCRVVVRLGAERITGTGFLIGPRLVLTNWHVVKSLLIPMTPDEAARHGLDPPEAWKALEGSGTALCVEFDFSPVPRHEPAA